MPLLLDEEVLILVPLLAGDGEAVVLELEEEDVDVLLDEVEDPVVDEELLVEELFWFEVLVERELLVPVETLRELLEGEVVVELLREEDERLLSEVEVERPPSDEDLTREELLLAGDVLTARPLYRSSCAGVDLVRGLVGVGRGLLLGLGLISGRP